MKKLFLLFGTVALLAGCNPKTSKEYIAAQQEIDSLKVVVLNKDNEVNSLFDALNEIEDNLSIVTSKFERVESLKRSNNEMTQDTKAKIGDQINEINEILGANKRKLADLSAKLKSSQNQVVKLTDFIAKLEVRVSEQDAKIQSVLTELEQKKIIIENLNKDVESLTLSGKEKDKVIEQKIAEANTAYYIVGTTKELTAIGVVNKKGGFIGIGKKKVLSNDINFSNFTTIDITKVKSVNIGKKKVKILSQHPANSYELVENDAKQVESLKIKNASEFWKLSRHLVIVAE